MALSLPSDFIGLMKAQLQSDYPAFEQALNDATPVSIRYNPQKLPVLPESFASIPWCKSGCYLEQRPVFTTDPLFHAGVYYVQEASSMLIGRMIEEHCDLSKKLMVLDLCAAPGGKSTLVSSLLSPDSVLVSNEIIKVRSQILKENLVKWGYPNVIVANHDPKDFETFGPYFDVILVDAPCSGEGMFRKDPNSIKEWSLANVAQSAGRQRKILKSALSVLKPNGLLIYSTCTYNVHENEENMRWLAEEGNLQECLLGDSTMIHTVKKSPGYQCYPHLVKGEGFYFAAWRNSDFEYRTAKEVDKKSSKWVELSKAELNAVAPFISNPTEFSFRKKHDGVICLWPKSMDQIISMMEQKLGKWAPIMEIGEVKGKDFIPAHCLALSTVKSEKIPNIELTLKEALHFLKKEQTPISIESLGWHTASYQQQCIGWIKFLGNRYNNYLPNHLKIRMDIDYELL